MKRKLFRGLSAALCAAVMMTSVLSAGTGVYAASENTGSNETNSAFDTSFIYGDADGDGDVRINDATLVQKHSVSLVSESELCFEACDVNDDGFVNIKDATLIQRYLSGIFSESLVGQVYEPETSVSTEPSDMTEPSEVTEPSDMTEPSEATEPSDMTEPSEATEPSDMTEPSEVTEPSDMTEPSETTEPSDMTEPSETTEPSDTTQAPSTTQPVTEATTVRPNVGTVKNITKTSFETNKITLTWDKVSGASGYFVYIKNADSSSSYTKIADVKSTTYTAANLSHTTQYHFKVAAYVTKDSVKYEGAATVKKTATQPGKVSNLRMVRSSSVIEFAWDRNSKATGYRIYRACYATNGEYVLYKTIRGNSTTSFSDTNIELGRAYYYSVRPFRELYNTEYNAPHATIKFICGMSAPDYKMTSQVSRVSLTWNKNKYATGYDIYYSTSKTGTFTLLGTTKNNYFNTVRLTDKKTYYFRVQPYKIHGANKTKILGTYATRSKTVTKNAYGQTVGGTYIEISIKQQHMWFYINGELYCQTDVVTGNADGTNDTPKGAFKIWQRLSPTVLVGPGYASPVDYWLAFTYSGVGIHDASWRSSGEYGGTTYMGNGSHGCVNTPYSAVKKIYQKASIGTIVVVY